MISSSVQSDKQNKFQSPRFRFIFANILIVVALCFASGFLLYFDYSHKLQNAEQQAINAAARYHDNAWLIMSGIDSVLRATAERLQDNPDSQTLHQFLEQTAASLPFLRTLIVVLPNGDVIGDSRPDEPALGVNIADRQYIINHVEGLVDGLDIDFPVASRVDGAWSIPVSLASHDDKGNLQWIAVVAFDPIYFAGLFIPEEINQVDYGFITNDRGSVLGTIPFDETLLNTSLQDTRLFTEQLPLNDTGLYYGQSFIHGEPSIIAYRTTETYPLYVVTLVDFSTINVQFFLDFIIILSVAVVLILITTLITRYQLAQLSTIEQQALTLKDSEERFQTLFSVAPVGIALLDDNSFVDINKHFTYILGYKAAEILGQSIITIGIDPISTQKLQMRFDTTGFVYNVELQVKHREGELVPILASARRIQLKDRALMLVAFSDLSDRIEGEKAKQIAETLKIQLEQEQEMYQFKINLISMIAHDLRTPVSVIMTSTNILDSYGDQISDERKDEHLLKILNQAKTLSRMIDEISGLQADDLMLADPEPETIQIKPMLENLIDNLQSATQNKCQIILQYSGHELCYQDRNLLQKIIVNLLSNAIKYSEKGKEVYLRCHCDDEQLRLEIADNGIGIPSEDQSHLFDIFYRASNVGKTFGTGIGLAIVKQTVDRLQGRISFESEENVGTTFTVYLSNRIQETV